MKDFFKQYSKYFVLAFMVGAFMPGNISRFLKTDLIDYEGKSIDDTLEIFHYEKMNTKVNEYLKLLTTEDNPNVAYVDVENCDDTNVSTYCLARELNDYLVEFETVMVEDKSNEIEFDNSDGLITLEEALQTAASQDTIIDDQIRSARDALDLTLNVYNQIQMVYPIHKELELLKLNLEEYRDNLGGVRDIIELYPSKFNDASTVSCQ